MWTYINLGKIFLQLVVSGPVLTIWYIYLFTLSSQQLGAMYYMRENNSNIVVIANTKTIVVIPQPASGFMKRVECVGQ